MLSKLQGKKPWGYMRISPWAWPVLNICFWINEAERKGDGPWGYELGFGLWASHWISLGISFRFYKVRQLGWICLLAQNMVYQAFVLTLVLLQILPAPTNQNMPKTHKILREFKSLDAFKQSCSQSWSFNIPQSLLIMKYFNVGN